MLEAIGYFITIVIGYLIIIHIKHDASFIINEQREYIKQLVEKNACLKAKLKLLEEKNKE